MKYAHYCYGRINLESKKNTNKTSLHTILENSFLFFIEIEMNVILEMFSTYIRHIYILCLALTTPTHSGSFVLLFKQISDQVLIQVSIYFGMNVKWMNEIFQVRIDKSGINDSNNNNSHTNNPHIKSLSIDILGLFWSIIYSFIKTCTYLHLIIIIISKLNNL